ncbi:unnamed protein product [Allacma fusca]|uniref:Uncharacterized protein n=1 Tax=Allacma fusca TaxID=39272 RepID=A0A8J2JTK2_9HEXA|nr:unnamed protein product [Allacma fusca]
MLYPKFSFSTWKFSQAVLWPREYFTLGTFPVHVLLVLGYIGCMCSIYCSFLAYPEVTAYVSNYALTEEDGVNQAGLSWRNVCLQEIVALCTPFIAISFYPLLIFIYIYNPNAPFLMFSWLKPKSSHWFTIMIIILTDAIMYMKIAKCSESIDEKINTHRLTPFHFIHFYRNCRHLQLTIYIFNVGFADNIFWLKNIALTLGIILISFSVLLFERSVISSFEKAQGKDRPGFEDVQKL